MNFHNIRYLWNNLCEYISPSFLWGAIKHPGIMNTLWNENSKARCKITNISFHKYKMTWKYISDSYYHMYNIQKHNKIGFSSSKFYCPFYYRKHANIREICILWCLGLLKYFATTLCHILIYDLAIFHWINWKTHEATVDNDSLRMQEDSSKIFWKFCFLSATIISTVRGIMSYDASIFSKILIFFSFDFQ